METIKDIRNDLLKRQEISILVEAEKNPGFEEMKKKVSEKLGKPEEVVDVYNIKGSFGSHEFKVDAYVYDSKEDLEKAALKKKKKGAGKKEVKVEKEKVEEESEEESKQEEKSEETEVSEKGGAPAEEKPEQEEKAVEEQKETEEEAKEP